MIYTYSNSLLLNFLMFQAPKSWYLTNVVDMALDATGLGAPLPSDCDKFCFHKDMILDSAFTYTLPFVFVFLFYDFHVVKETLLFSMSYYVVLYDTAFVYVHSHVLFQVFVTFIYYHVYVYVPCYVNYHIFPPSQTCTQTVFFL